MNRLSFSTTLIAFSRLIRWKNLLLGMLAMVFTRYALIHVALGHDNIPDAYGATGFPALVLSMIFLAAGGYAINDYFDVRIDRINKPDKMIAGRLLPFSLLLKAHQVFTGLGIALGLYAGYRAGSYSLGGLQVVLAASLWFYSFRYKGTFLLGNLLVSTMTAAVILIVWLFEFFALRQDPLAFAGALPGFGLVTRLVLVYAAFAFLVSMSREIVKDIGDAAGDASYGCRTLPVRYGPHRSYRVAAGFQLFTLAALVLVQVFYLRSFVLQAYTVLFIELPLLYALVLSLRSGAAEENVRIERLLKLILAAGVLSMLIIPL